MDGQNEKKKSAPHYKHVHKAMLLGKTATTRMKEIETDFLFFAELPIPPNALLLPPILSPQAKRGPIRRVQRLAVQLLFRHTNGTNYCQHSTHISFRLRRFCFCSQTYGLDVDGFFFELVVVVCVAPIRGLQFATNRPDEMGQCSCISFRGGAFHLQITSLI